MPSAASAGGQLPDPGVLPVDQPVGRLHQGDRGAKPGQDLAELDPDRAAADDQRAAGDLPQLGGLPVGPHLDPGLVQALDGRAARVGAGGNDDVGGGQPAPVDADPARAVHPAGAADDQRAVAFEALGLGGVVEVAGHPVAVGGNLGPGERGGGDPGGAGGLGLGLGWAQQGLGGHAGPVGALAAMSSRSTTATRLPAASRRHAAASPPGPIPSTITSTSAVSAIAWMLLSSRSWGRSCPRVERLRRDLAATGTNLYAYADALKSKVLSKLSKSKEL
jgi:hypothetical protein